MSEFIDRVNDEEDVSLPEGHRARAYADDLPEWHPVRRLFTGASQWLGQLKDVYGFFHLFCDVYDDYIWRPSPTDPPVDALSDFLRIFPNDVVYRGHRYRMHRLYHQARTGIEAATAEAPQLRESGLDAFDRTFSDLVRSIRST